MKIDIPLMDKAQPAMQQTTLFQQQDQHDERINVSSLDTTSYGEGQPSQVITSAQPVDEFSVPTPYVPTIENLKSITSQSEKNPGREMWLWVDFPEDAIDPPSGFAGWCDELETKTAALKHYFDNKNKKRKYEGGKSTYAKKQAVQDPNLAAENSALKDAITATELEIDAIKHAALAASASMDQLQHEIADMYNYTRNSSRSTDVNQYKAAIQHLIIKSAEMSKLGNELNQFFNAIKESMPAQV